MDEESQAPKQPIPIDLKRIFRWDIIYILLYVVILPLILK